MSVPPTLIFNMCYFGDAKNSGSPLKIVDSVYMDRILILDL